MRRRGRGTTTERRREYGRGERRKTGVLHVRISARQAEALARLAKWEDTTVSELVCRFIDWQLALQEIAEIHGSRQMR